MANHSCGRNRQARTVSVKSVPAATAFTEPEVHRWPHPVDGVDAVQSSNSELHYIHCALAYQNQLLADIKALLDHLSANINADSSEK